jgi:hypothetical protein
MFQSNIILCRKSFNTPRRESFKQISGKAKVFLIHQPANLFMQQFYNTYLIQLEIQHPIKRFFWLLWRAEVFFGVKHNVPCPYLAYEKTLAPEKALELAPEKC